MIFFSSNKPTAWNGTYIFTLSTLIVQVHHANHTGKKIHANTMRNQRLVNVLVRF
jgi:hypothetical protein